MRIALCIFFEFTDSNMPRKLKLFITAQQPKLGPIFFQDIQWTLKTMKGFGKMLTIMIAYIFFNIVEDFIAGQICINGSVVEWIVAARIREI